MSSFDLATVGIDDLIEELYRRFPVGCLVAASDHCSLQLFGSGTPAMQAGLAEAMSVRARAVLVQSLTAGVRGKGSGNTEDSDG